MDCQRLRGDIDKLTEQKNRLEQLFEQSRESGMGKSKIAEAIESVEKTEDDILERYLYDFCEKTSFEWSRAEVTALPRDCSTINIASLSDGRMAVYDDHANLHFYSKDETTGEYSIEYSVELPDSAQIVSAPDDKLLVIGNDYSVRSFDEESGMQHKEIVKDVNKGILLKNGDALFFGRDGHRLVLASRQDDGTYAEGQTIKEENLTIAPSAIAVALSGGGAVIGDEKRVLVCSPSPDGSYELRELDEKLTGAVTAIESFPNGDILVAVGNEEIRVIRKREDGSYGESELVVNCREELGKTNDIQMLDSMNIDSMCAMEDGNVLINRFCVWYSSEGLGDFNPVDTICVCRRRDDGSYEFKEGLLSSWNRVRLYGRLSSGGIMISHDKYWNGVIGGNESGVDRLKKYLPSIAQKPFFYSQKY